MGHENGHPGDNASNNYSHHDWALRVVHHNVTITGLGGHTATVVITVQRGQVWLSIQPPFTWEAIMTAGKVDELIRTLGVAGDEAKKMVSDLGGTGGRTQAAGQSAASSSNGAGTFGDRTAGAKKALPQEARS